MYLKLFILVWIHVFDISQSICSLADHLDAFSSACACTTSATDTMCADLATANPLLQGLDLVCVDAYRNGPGICVASCVSASDASCAAYGEAVGSTYTCDTDTSQCVYTRITPTRAPNTPAPLTACSLDLSRPRETLEACPCDADDPSNCDAAAVQYGSMLLGIGLESIACDTDAQHCTVSCTSQAICDSAARLMMFSQTMTCAEAGYCYIESSPSSTQGTSTTEATESTESTESTTTGNSEDEASCPPIDCDTVAAYRCPEDCIADYGEGDGCSIRVSFTATVCNIDAHMSQGKLKATIRKTIKDVIDHVANHDVVCEDNDIKLVTPLKVTRTDGQPTGTITTVDGCPLIGDLCADADALQFEVAATFGLYCGECTDLYFLAQELLVAAEDGTFANDFDAYAESVSKLEDTVCNSGLGTVQVQSPVTIALVTETGAVYEREIALNSAAAWPGYLGGMLVMLMAVLSFLC